jgi:hypothetical protein
MGSPPLQFRATALESFPMINADFFDGNDHSPQSLIPSASAGFLKINEPDFS